jgi:VanZ family protein
MFAVFVLLMIIGFQKEGNPQFFIRQPVITAILCALLFGVVMELIQHYLIPNRFGSVYDEIANGVGCLAGWGMWRLVNKFTAKTPGR